MLKSCVVKKFGSQKEEDIKNMLKSLGVKKVKVNGVKTFGC